MIQYPVNENAIDLTITLNVPDLKQLADWPPETLAAFMAGIAQIVSANRVVIDNWQRRSSSHPPARAARE